MANSRRGHGSPTLTSSSVITRVIRRDRGSAHAKHQAGWLPQLLPDGTIEWTSPTGHTYRDEPATYPVDRTVELSQPVEAAEANATDADPPPF